MSIKDNLWKVAKAQQGYFTAKQATQSGYRDANFGAYVKRGHWEKVHRGIYRLQHFPSYPRPELIIWSLWSQTAVEPGIGVWSYETALEIYDISDVNPVKLQMTIPKGFQRAKLPREIQFHIETLSRWELQKIDGFYVTTPLRTIVDVFKENTLEPCILKQCVQEAISKGHITKIELLRAKQVYPVVEKILEVAGE